jgi:hypothetical protein
MSVVETRGAITVCWGAGWDSTAMLIEMERRGIRPDLITMADVGAEKQGTYDFIPIFSQWCLDVGFPEPTICVYEPMAKTADRYREAVISAAEFLSISLDEVRIKRLSRIFGNMIANETLPGIAFGMKSCSIKWKVEAQEPPRCRSNPLLDTWARGERVSKFIGFDATEDHRTFADGKGLDIGGGEGVPKYCDRYDVDYPLRRWGIDRAGCGRIITAAGLPLPPKSACFFCPAMKLIEIEQLKSSDPELYALAIEMERMYRAGRHFRGADLWTVSGSHRITGEKIKYETNADDAATARLNVRSVLKDVRPYQWALSVSQAVPGLGRSFAWGDLEPVAS